MLLDPNIAYAKKMGIDESKIRRALIDQLERSNLKFTNHRDLIKAIRELPEDTEKYMLN